MMLVHIGKHTTTKGKVASGRKAEVASIQPVRTQKGPSVNRKEPHHREPSGSQSQRREMLHTDSDMAGERKLR